jgi:branched-chain amino acid transport system substrate-binding protein
MEHVKLAIAIGLSAQILAVTAALAQAPAGAQPVRIGVIDDLSGIFSGNGGSNTVLATTMAVEDFGRSVLGRPVEVISADHQNKPDIGASLARQFVDQRGVSAIVNGGASSVGLAIQAYARERKITTLISGGYAANFSGEGCSPFGTQWAPSTGALANAVAEAIVRAGGKKWYFITADYVFGHNLTADASRAVREAGGQVAGETKHPLGATDLSSPLLAAQASGADIIGLSNAGPDLVTTIKQAREFGVASKLTAMLVFANNVVAMGLDQAQGLRFAVNFYWDANEETRAWAKRIMARNGNTVPTMGHALAYVATTHYLKAVAEAGSTEPEAVARAMRTLPITGNLLANPKVQANGRVTMDMLLVEVKKPSESKHPADLYRILDTIPAAKLFAPAEQSGCKFLVQG